MSTLQNKTAVISGGFGQIGQAVAKKLSSLGARIVLLVRSNLNDATHFVSQLPGSNHLVIRADVTDTNSLKMAVEQISQCDILINCAAITSAVDPLDLNTLTDEMFDQIITTNLRGTYATIREFIKLLEQSDDGLIINITSTAGIRPGPNNLAYAASKAGVDILTKSLSARLAPNVRIISIAPGMLEQNVSGGGKHNNEKKNRIILDTPMKKIVTAEDVALVVQAYAITIKYATGSVIILDGGRTV